jgi:predicted glycogen debranching enzyme
MPNLFPEGTQQPLYNTVDAALLFILAVYEYEKKTGDSSFVKRAYPIMKEIVHWYETGTDFNIHMDEDGLIVAGSGYDQVTWMDVRVENILPTPRHGKPVEINAYWYNALCMMDEWQKKLGTSIDNEEEQKDICEVIANDTKDYAGLALKVKESFEKAFWNEEKNCLKDVISNTKADEQIRCNQIWAVSQPFSVLSKEKEKQVVETLKVKSR